MLIVLPGSKGEIAVNISDFWEDQNGIGVRGWVSAESGPPDDLEFVHDGIAVPVTSWHARDDIAEKAPTVFRGMAWGFWCYLPSTATPSIAIRRRNSKSQDGKSIRLKRHPAKIPEWQKPKSSNSFDEFRSEVNRGRGRVLELGSRQVCPGGQSKRSLFPDCSYVGFDYYGDANTDVAGDAHELSRFFGSEFDAVFSLAVLEAFRDAVGCRSRNQQSAKSGGLDVPFHALRFSVARAALGFLALHRPGPANSLLATTGIRSHPMRLRHASAHASRYAPR